MGLALLLPGTALAIQSYVDFGDSAGPGAPSYSNLGSGDSNTTVDLHNLDNTDNFWDLEMPSVLDGAGLGWNAALPANWFRAAVEDFVVLTANNSVFDFEGLDPNFQYVVEVVMSRNVAGATQDVTINGVTTDDWDPQVDGYQNGNTLTYAAVTPTGGGRIRVRIHRDGPTGVVNAIRVTMIPEPARLLLLGSLALLLPLLRRAR